MAERPADSGVTSVSKEEVKTDVSGVLSAGPVVEAGKAKTMPGGESWGLLSLSMAASTVHSMKSDTADNLREGRLCVDNCCGQAVRPHKADWSAMSG